MAVLDSIFSQEVDKTPDPTTPGASSREESSDFFLPSYMISADTLNVANRNQTFAESFADGVQSVPKFIATSLISGANQLYNAPLSIANLFGADYELSDTGDVIKELDSNLAKFYEEHKEGSDLVGFIASSIIPGLGGVKVLSAGQTSLRAAINANKFGTGTSKALGLLVPQKEKWISKAVKEVINSNAAPMITNRNTLRAIGAGMGQNIMEASAFEIAVAATMFDSPVLENQDLGDLVSNIMWGGVVFGGVGGLLAGTKTAYTVKKARKAADVATHPWKGIDEYADATKPSERIALDIEQLNNIPAVPEKGLEVADELINPEILTQAAASKAERLSNRIRSEIGNLAKNDQEAATVMFNLTKGVPQLKQQGTFIGAEAITRMADKSNIEREISGLAKKIKLQKASLGEVDKYTNLNVAYHKAWGDDAGKVFQEAPTPIHISDYLRKGQKIEVSGNSIKAGDYKYTFNRVAEKDTYNILKASPLETQARYIWAMKSAPLAKPTAKAPFVVKENDIPLLEKALRDVDIADMQHVHIKYDSGVTATISNADTLSRHIKDKKLHLIHKLHEESVAGRLKSERFAADTKLSRMLGLDSVDNIADVDKALVGKYSAKSQQLSQEEIASIVNVRNSLLDGVERTGGGELDDLFALQSYAKEYSNLLRKNGTLKQLDPDVDIWNVPQHVKVSYNSTDLEDLSTHVVENMTILKQKQRIYTDGVNRQVMANLGAEDYDRLVEVTHADIRETASSVGVGAGRFTSANANYGSAGAKAEYLGNTLTGMRQRAQNVTREVMEPALYKLAQNKEAVIEWSTLNNTLRSIPERYVLNAEGTAFEIAEIARWKAKAAAITAKNDATAAARKAAGKKPVNPKPIPKKPSITTADAPESIPITNKEVAELARLHIEHNGKKVEGLRNLNTARGVMDTKDPEVFYPIPVNPKDFPYFAMVEDASITGTGHKKMLYANTERELSDMIDKLKNEPHLTIRTKAEVEQYYKDHGAFSFEKSLNENYLDHTLHRKGVSASYFVPTDPKKVADDFLNWHLQRDFGYINENVLAKYEIPFKELQRLGDAYTNISTSKFSNLSRYRHADEVVENPYGNYIRTALGLKNYADYPWWTATNRLVDDAVSKMYGKVDKIFATAKTDEELKKINDVLRQHGYKGAAYDETMEVFANADAPRGVLSNVVQKANSILAAITLRLDPLNAVNNAVSANVLLGAESRAVIKAIERGDAEAVGKLAELAKITVPGTDRLILSPTKLIANSIKKFGTNTPEMEFYRKHRFVTSISDQYQWTLDNMTFNGRESIAAWDNRLKKVHSTLSDAVKKGEGLTGNRLAEEFNRFVAADVMKQISDIAVEKGLISAREQLTYINTFVNRTQANYLAAQRPMMFQGPIGQAVGLFQTYQFNLMQQLLRHVGEGTAKDAMTLIALQGTIHGMNGLPAFHAMNEHIIGNASGNTQHRDLYDATYGVVGKQTGDWLLYGAASNLTGLLHPDLKVNLYTRGDINPRHVTILPSSIADIPVIGASAKVFGNLVETAKKINAGGDVATTLLQGLEHNGVSRPLAGLAQTLEALANPLGQSYSTSNRGNVIASNDLLSLANMGRILGGKPMDEAIAIDATYRLNAYGLRDIKKRNLLGESIKTTLIAGQEPTTEQIEEFAAKYVETGGKQDKFNEWFTQLYKAANTSQANKMSQDLNSNFSQSMQKIMGGNELRDFY